MLPSRPTGELSPSKTMTRTTKTERIALLVIALGFLASGYLDAQDAKLMDRVPVQLACIQCAGAAR